jgi:hypothetical protein
LPEDDEDDELANSRDHEFAARDPVTSSESKAVQSLDDGSKAPETASDKSTVPKPSKSAKKPKKKKLKRGKTTSEVMKKTYHSDVEDDVIWVEPRPLQVEGVDQEQKTSSEDHEPSVQTSSASEEKSSTANVLEKPAPKKQSRKRKKTTEDTGGESAQESNATMVVQAEPEEAILETAKQTTSKDPIPTPQHPSQPESLPPTEEKETPQTPNNPQPTNTETSQDSTSETVSKDSGKGPKQHSPIASTSKVPFRVGLSRRARIAPLLKIVRK